MKEEMCGRFDTDVFIAADLCCSCHGGETVAKAEEGESCIDWNESAGRYYPDCAQGLVCEQQETPSTDGSYMMCVIYTHPGDNSDGLWYGRDGSTGYWFYSDGSTADAGYWITEDATMRGYWNFDEGSEV